MEKGISKKGSTATINNITLFNQQPIKRRCSPGCGKIFKTTEGGPRICPKCRKKLKVSLPKRSKNSSFPRGGRRKGINDI